MDSDSELNEFKAKRLVVTLAFCAVAFVAACIVGIFTNALGGLGAFLLITIPFFGQGFKRIDATTFVVPIFQDQMYDCALDKWQFFPFLGVLTKFRLLSGEVFNLAMTAEERTPDNGTVLVDPFFTWRISRQHPKRFILAGGADAVTTMFRERVVGRVREWITSEREGPQTWKEALKSNGPAVYVLIEKLFPRSIPRIPDDVLDRSPELRDIRPIGFVRYFTGRPPLPEFKTDTAGNQIVPPNAPELWKEESLWKKILDELKRDDRVAWNELERTVNKQLDFVNCIKTGGVGADSKPITFAIDDIGIEILIANIGGIKATGKTSTAADLVAEETQNALVQDIASKNMREEISAALPIVGGDHKLAVELVQLRRKLTTKNVSEQQYGLAPDVIANLAKLIEALRRRP